MEPEVYISADDSFDIVLIDGRILITDSIPIRTIRMYTIRQKDASRIVSVDGQTGRMPTGTFQLVKLDVINDRIVIILRKLVVITDRNEYHGLVRHSLNGCD